jgi:hypothetical protein
MGVPYGGLVNYCFKLTYLPHVTDVKNVSPSCVLRLGLAELHEILERPEGK